MEVNNSVDDVDDSVDLQMIVEYQYHDNVDSEVVPSVPDTSTIVFDYHATRLFNLVDRDGQSYPYRNIAIHRDRVRRNYMGPFECLELIENELDTNPNSIYYVNEYQQSALHLAVSQPVVSFDIVSALIKAHPDIVKLQNCNGNLAMHILILYKCNCKTLRLLYDMYPESIKVLNSRQETPIETAMKKKDRLPPADTLDDASIMVAMQLC